MDIKEFGLYMAKLREKSGYESQRQLSLKSGVSNGTIARIEAGTQKASPATLKKLAPFLKDVTYEDLMKAMGYIEESTNNETDKHDHYDSLTEITKLVKEYGLDQIGFFDIEEWKNLSPEDVRMIEEHFKMIVKLAKERNKKED